MTEKVKFTSPITGQPLPEPDEKSQICPYCKTETNLHYRIGQLPKDASVSDVLGEISKWEKEVVEVHGLCGERHAISGRITV